MYLTREGKVPVHWWTKAVNFGDLLAPWLVRRITGRDVAYAEMHEHCYVVIGSILGHVTRNSIVWGAGSFGTETLRRTRSRAAQQFAREARYLAVRGPLTRNKLEAAGIACPRVYGDPALLTPDYYRPKVTPSHEVGIVLRWSEKDVFDRLPLEGVHKIWLKSDDIEGTVDAIASCKRILSSSLHGLILADAYGIPNAWLDSDTPHGREFKYWDYLISVNKVRPPLTYDLTRRGVSLGSILDEVPFDARPIQIDLPALRDACPFVPGREPDVVVPAVPLKRRWILAGPRELR
jgi:pyruvyltransferase